MGSILLFYFVEAEGGKGAFVVGGFGPSGAYVRGLLSVGSRPGDYVRGALVRGDYVRGLSSGGLCPRLMSYPVPPLGMQGVADPQETRPFPSVLNAEFVLYYVITEISLKN